MHISIVCNDTAYFLRHRRTVADALAERGNAVSVLAGGDPLPPDLEHDWTFKHIPIERFSFALVADCRLVLASFADFVRNRPSAVYLVTLKPAVLSGVAAVAARMLTRTRTRIVITIPGLGRLMAPDSPLRAWRHKLARRTVRGVIRWLSNRRDVRFVFETEADRAVWLSQGMVRANNSEQIDGAGVDASLFYPAQGRGRAPYRVLFASRLLRTKGLDVFLQVARRLRPDRSFQFVVAGMADENDPDSMSAAELALEPSIEFLGAVEDMPSLLRSVDLVCLPTRYGEGIPRILIEAAACGLPSIASDLEGCRRIVEDGVTGYIISRKAEEAVPAMMSALGEYRARPDLLMTHGAAARERFASGGFSNEYVVSRYLDMLIAPSR